MDLDELAAVRQVLLFLSFTVAFRRSRCLPSGREVPRAQLAVAVVAAVARRQSFRAQPSLRSLQVAAEGLRIQTARVAAALGVCRLGAVGTLLSEMEEAVQAEAGARRLRAAPVDLVTLVRLHLRWWGLATYQLRWVGLVAQGASRVRF